jgi:thioredoxin reductase/NAD-dependent dihydropyrimidine dehydrogenase PreA subunit
VAVNERKRSARRAVASSDVLRFRGVIAAVIVAAVSAITIVALAVDSPGSPGPVSAPHRSFECASCHAESDTSASCAGCHGGHGSTRHSALFASGELRCASCHVGHGERGVTFSPDGSAIVSGHDDVRASTSFRPSRSTYVPLVAIDTCAECHERTARDPISSCGTTDVLCFDEHGSGREAAWEAARDIAIRTPRDDRPSYTPFFAIFGAAMFGAIAFVIERRLRTRPPKREKRAALPVIADKVRLPRIDTNTCLGCYACVDACPYDVLAIEQFVAVVIKPKDCCGLTLCEQVCPNGSLAITDGEVIEDRPNVSEALESIDRPGLYLAGDLTGAPLIRNAIAQGALAVRAIAGDLPRGSEVDLVIVGAGPAGISAALEAKTRGLRYVALEQGSVAESIRSFPRGKLVLDQPIEMPAGGLWLEQSTKEELLSKWTRIVRSEGLVIREGHRVTAIEREGELFVVRAIAEREVTLRAKRVLLALGRRGTPRKLEVSIPEDAQSRVHYSVADARSHAGARAVIVGLGDVAMEAAIALARQPGTEVTLVARADSFARGKARNVTELERAIANGRARVIFAATIAEVTTSEVALSDGRRLPFDALFVMIGSLPPWPFLEAAGVRRVKSR